MSFPLVAAAAAVVLLFVLLLLVPRFLLMRAQDRLAKEAMAREGVPWRLLTRAQLVVGRYRRIPGILGLREDVLSFEGLFGESVLLPTSRIQGIETGSRLSSGRLLYRLEVLRVKRGGGEALEFVLGRASAFAWRSHLGLSAARERQTDADRVVPGRR